VGHAVSFLFVNIIRLADRELCLHGARLLYDVSEFVREQLASARTVGVILAAAEKDVLAYGEGASVEIPAERVGLRIGMHPDAAEIGAESRLHFGANAVANNLPASRRALNSILHRGRDFICLARFAGRRQKPLHKTVAMRPLNCDQ
jgi:hypothetical protein